MSSVGYSCLSAMYASIPVLMFLRSAMAAALYALARYAENCGMAIAARMRMIAKTIKSSRRVKPLLLLSLRNMSVSFSVVVCCFYKAGGLTRSPSLQSHRTLSNLHAKKRGACCSFDYDKLQHRHRQ